MISPRNFAVRVAWLLSPFAGVLVLADCATDPGGPPFITLGVTMSGGSPRAADAGAEDADLCVRIPVLLGSNVEKRKSLGNGVSADVRADRDGADVTFSGVDDDSSARSYTIDELEQGVAEVVTVVSGGESLDVTIASGCTNP